MTILSYKTPVSSAFSGSTTLKVVKRKTGSKGNLKNTKFEEYLEMGMHNSTVLSTEEDLEMELKLAKKLNVKAGKLRGEDDRIKFLCALPIAQQNSEKSSESLLNRLSESNVESITREISNIFYVCHSSYTLLVLCILSKFSYVMYSAYSLPMESEGYGRVVYHSVHYVSTHLQPITSGAASQIISKMYAAVFGTFVAGMACFVGNEFSAKLMASLAKYFELFLIAILLIMLPSDMIYDFLLTLSKRLTDVDVSIILTTLQRRGLKIRPDDPAAMKKIILSVQDCVNELKLRVENILIRGLKWSKLLDPEKKGQWWLSGDMASTMDNVEEVANTIDKEEEKSFNKYYTVLALKLCEHDKNHKFTLQSGWVNWVLEKKTRQLTSWSRFPKSETCRQLPEVSNQFRGEHEISTRRRKQASVDYEKGEHEVSTRLISLRKADIPKHYRGTASESRPIAFRGIGLYRKWSIKSSGSVLMTTLRAC
nr:hypothetical protein CFP56_26401 [Quercus suber]